jgi:hypothetical protein
VHKLGIAALFAACIALLSAGCSAKANKVLPTIVTTTTVAGTTPPLPTLHFAVPEEAIKHLILQWQAGDREAAGQAATPEAVAALFGKPSKNVQFRSCSTSPASNLGSDCVYRYNDGLIRLHLTTTNGDWRVATVAYENV